MAQFELLQVDVVALMVMHKCNRVLAVDVVHQCIHHSMYYSEMRESYLTAEFYPGSQASPAHLLNPDGPDEPQDFDARWAGHVIILDTAISHIHAR